MKRTSPILVIAFLLLLDTLHSQNSLDNELIKQHFSSTEIIGLQKIIAFTDSLVQSARGNADINNSYHSLLDSIRDQKIDFAFNEEIKYSFLFSLDSSLFNKIWIKYSDHRKIWTKDTILINPKDFITVGLNYRGEFVKLIDDLGDTNHYYKVFSDNIKAAGDISPTVYAGFLYNHLAFDFENIFNRLWAAVFLLSIEENIELKVKRYLIK